MSLTFELALRSSAILSAGLVLDTLLRNRAAALRHVVLAGAIAAAALVVPLGLILPAWAISLPAKSAVAAAAPAPAVHAPAPIVAAPAARIRTPARPAISPEAGIWLAGFLAATATLLAGVARLVRIASRAGRSRDERWTRMTSEVAAAYGLRREIIVLQTEAPDLLATWGVFRPRVLLPSHARDWSDERIHVVLCHELAHIRRLDWLVQMSAEALRTVLWFNPLIWIACTRLRRASEQACDDAVLGRGVAARDYAAQLLDLARTCRRSEAAPLPAVPMARPSTLERRIADMLNPQLDRRPLSRRSIGLVAAFLLAVTLPAAAIRAAQNSPATLSGSVYDATGGVLPGVEITLEDITQMKVQAVTNAAGHFGFSNVQPGRYVLSAALPGFRALRQEFDLQARPRLGPRGHAAGRRLEGNHHRQRVAIGRRGGAVTAARSSADPGRRQHPGAAQARRRQAGVSRQHARGGP